MPANSALSDFILAVPKVELHLHLVGSASPSTVAALAARRPGAGVPSDLDELLKFFEFTDFAHFIEFYSTVNSLVRDGEAIVSMIDGAAADLAAQQVRYVEMTITPYSHVVDAGIAYDEVLEALAEGRSRARRRGVEFAWVYDIPGEMGEAAAEFTTHAAVNNPPDGLVGLGLGGVEAGVDRARFAEYFDRARAVGLRSVPHAGEADGPASVWAALGFLRADRIGHGVRAIDDDRLVAHLVEHQIPLEVCRSIHPQPSSHHHERGVYCRHSASSRDGRDLLGTLTNASAAVGRQRLVDTSRVDVCSRRVRNVMATGRRRLENRRFVVRQRRRRCLRDLP